jgi:hypothetical protein
MTERSMAADNDQAPEAAGENRKSLVAFLRSIRFLRRRKKPEAPECEGHFAELKSRVDSPSANDSANDDDPAVRSAN